MDDLFGSRLADIDERDVAKCEPIAGAVPCHFLDFSDVTTARQFHWKMEVLFEEWLKKHCNNEFQVHFKALLKRMRGSLFCDDGSDPTNPYYKPSGAPPAYNPHDKPYKPTEAYPKPPKPYTTKKPYYTTTKYQDPCYNVKCHKYAQCKEGKCICKPGYNGDGYSCKKPYTPKPYTTKKPYTTTTEPKYTKPKPYAPPSGYKPYEGPAPYKGYCPWNKYSYKSGSYSKGSKSLKIVFNFLTDTGKDSKLVHRRKRPKVDTLFSSLFFSVASERRV